MSIVIRKFEFTEDESKLLDSLVYPIQQMLTTYERKCLLALAMRSCEFYRKPKILEFGTWRGLTTNLLSKAFPEGHIYTIDQPNAANLPYPQTLPDDEIGMYVENKNNVTFIKKDSLLFSSFEQFKFDQLDFVFIDGAHDYEHVKHDFDEAHRAVRCGAPVVMDDVSYDHIREFRRINATREDAEKMSNAMPSFFIYEKESYDWVFLEGTSLCYNIPNPWYAYT